MYSRKIEVLKEQHRLIKKQLEDVAHMTDEEAHELKKEKLRIKDEIETLTNADKKLGLAKWNVITQIQMYRNK